jgi:hypothetical protein
VHSKLVISRPLRKKEVPNLQKESSFSENQILELQEFFRNKKVFDFSISTCPTQASTPRRSNAAKPLFLKRTAHRLKKGPSPEPRHLSMQSVRGHRVFKVYEEVSEVFDTRSVDFQNEGYFNTDNDVDTDEEQQKKAIENNLNCVALGHQTFLRDFQRGQSKSPEVQPRLRPTGKGRSQNN